MKSRTEYRTMEMQVPIKSGENSRAAFELVRRTHGAVTNLEVVDGVGTKHEGAMITVSFLKRVRLSKAERMQA